MVKIISSLPEDEIRDKFVTPETVLLVFTEFTHSRNRHSRVFMYSEEFDIFYTLKILKSAIDLMKDIENRQNRVVKFKTFINYLDYKTDIPIKDDIVFSHIVVPHHSIGMINVAKFNQFLEKKYNIQLTKQQIVSWVCVKHLCGGGESSDEQYFNGILYELENFDRDIQDKRYIKLFQYNFYQDGIKSMRELFDKYPDCVFFDSIRHIIEHDMMFFHGSPPN